ncbi:MAG: radical SAM protein [Syntrophobacteraceae bacterium]
MDYMQCSICELRCRVAEGRAGSCGLYELRDGRVAERFADHYLVACPISIETMPILHFHPGTKFLQITTTGCNFNCPGCISTVLVREMDSESPALQHLSAEQVVSRAFESQCSGIVFLMNDPIAAFPTFLKVAKLARERGLKVGCASNAYFTPEALAELAPCLDFINIGMKGFTDSAYRNCGAPGIEPVLRNMKALHDAGVHVEVSCILTRENQDEIKALAQYVAGLARSVPLQVMRFLPFETADIALEPSIRDAEAFCGELNDVLDYVYLFNTPGSELLHTYCPQCREVVMRREFYGPMGAKIRLPEKRLPHAATCPSCGSQLAVIGPPAESSYQEGDFEGGYPLTRALEMVEAMLIAMGVAEKAVVARAWEDVLQDGGLNRLHMSIQHPRTYIEAVRYFGSKANVLDRSEALAAHLEDRLARVEAVAASASTHPRVYYAMGKPLFYFNGGRLENQLVETAGGVSLNRQLPPGGRPGRTLAVSELNALNPEVIFISAFISNSVEDFCAECLERGIDVDAVRNRRVYAHPARGWDFGSPRWVLGLMVIASTLHPEECSFDLAAEADALYREFYGMPFDVHGSNLSFSKPDRRWRWKK